MEPTDGAEDSYWKLGFIYYNPGDSRIMVKKRFGFGWTFNFANVWSYVILVIAITVFIVVSKKYYNS